jgi:hypothetical protein
MSDLRSPEWMLDKSREDRMPVAKEGHVDWNASTIQERKVLQAAPFGSQQTSAYQSRKRVWALSIEPETKGDGLADYSQAQENWYKAAECVKKQRMVCT